jgi:soluble P-type ATPase
LHNTLDEEAIFTESTVGSVIVAVVETVQPFASVAVTVYVPIGSDDAVAVKDPLDH